MRSVIVSAAAKINWTLDIVGRREDSYHELDMLMQRITLYDTVRITRTDEKIALSSNLSWLPTDERNLAYKSASIFFEKTGFSGGCDIKIAKNIPSGAGLAGGSADAAATLAGLNALYDRPLSEEDLSGLAFLVGSDVPYMLKSGLYRARGTGNELTRTAQPRPIPILCVMNARQNASTRAVYERFDEIGTSVRPDTDAFLDALLRRDTAGMTQFGGNVLTESASQIAPSIPVLRDRLRDAGAKFVTMTGSGSAVVGVFDSVGDASRAGRLFPHLWKHACLASSCGIRIKEC